MKSTNFDRRRLLSAAAVLVLLVSCFVATLAGVIKVTVAKPVNNSLATSAERNH